MRYILIGVGCVLLFSMFTLMLLRRLMRRRMNPGMGTFDTRLRPLPMRGELEELVMQIQQVSREQIARLDTKIRMLNQLILDADEKKKELEKIVYGTRVEKREDPAPVKEKMPPARPANPLHDKVYGLKDEGKDLKEISRTTGLEEGEVQLILGLRDVK